MQSIHKRFRLCYHVITQPVCGDDILGKTERGVIIDFLRRCKEYIGNDRFEFVRRRECLRTLISLEMEIKDVEQMILALHPANYAKGPEDDHDPDHPGDIYVFGATVGETELYIKLKCDESRGCVCISFHEAVWPFTYPYQER